MNGWVRIYRSLADHPIWTGQRFTAGQAWVDLIMLANFTDSRAFQGNKPILVRRGQVLTSQVALAARWGWNRKTVVSFLKALKADIMLDIETSRETDTGYTLITIRNYERFQVRAEEGADIQTSGGQDIRTDIERTSNGHLLRREEERGERVRTTPAAKKSNGKVPPGYQEAVDFWFAEFERTKGSKPQFDQAEGRCLKRLLAAHSLPQVKALITHMLTRTQLRHIRERHAYSLHSLLGSWNELWAEYRARALQEGEEIPA